MSDDEAPKSAIEIAMAKLKARGGFEETALTDQQKAEISEIRTKTTAKIAELEIHEQGKIQALLRAGAFEEAEALQAELSRQKAKLNEETDALVHEVRERKS